MLEATGGRENYILRNYIICTFHQLWWDGRHV